MRKLVTLCALAVCAFAATSAVAAPAKKKAPAVPVTSKKTPPTVPTSQPESAPSEQPQSSVRGPTRIDFDDRLIQGQTNKSGAVYLYDRKELKIRSMIKKRENFREEIVGSLYDS